MIRAINTELQLTLATKFGLTETRGSGAAPRDIHFCRIDLARRHRQARMKAEAGVDMVEMPFVNFYPTAFRWAEDRRNRAVSHSGVPFITADDGSSTDALMKVYKWAPVDIDYQVDYWHSANNIVEVMEAVRAWLLWRELPTPMEMTDENGCTVALQVHPDDPVDNSDLEDMFEQGAMYRYTFGIMVEGYVTDPPESFRTIASIDYDIYADLNGDELFGGKTLT